ncbi:tRNA epoxyqueuosine(34) reductase QueG [Clostridium hydrogenum]|uniref:tRNA epoxyqueuosine(34) reductase QueG n=1 Tax=Clostridium hydrogenum TaxID=2855764 RepID=UPI001F1E78DE|nr:tRNA epoxyqueuosine(34) reductase QueG [Clostridium hydrogenum]
MDFKSEILKYCSSIGLNTVGFMECRKFEELNEFYKYRKNNNLENEFEESNIGNRINPFIYMEHGKTIISIAFPYLHKAIINDKVYFSKYTLGNDYHKVLGIYLEKICDFIKTLGGDASYFVDNNALPERYIAYTSGIGFIGKNNMIITPKYGSYVFLGEIITNLEIEADSPIENKCGECNLCKAACPTGCIKEKVANSNICLSYITQKKQVEDFWFEKFKGRLFGCDMCQDVCPYNKNAKTSSIKEFEPYDFMEKANIDELIKIDNAIFREKYKNTSCGWRGKNILQRNALINLISMEKNKNIAIDSIKSPYVKEYYNRLLKLFKL